MYGRRCLRGSEVAPHSERLPFVELPREERSPIRAPAYCGWSWSEVNAQDAKRLVLHQSRARHGTAPICGLVGNQRSIAPQQTALYPTILLYSSPGPRLQAARTTCTENTSSALRLPPFPPRVWPKQTSGKLDTIATTAPHRDHQPLRPFPTNSVPPPPSLAIARPPPLRLSPSAAAGSGDCRRRRCCFLESWLGPAVKESTLRHTSQPSHISSSTDKL